MRHGRVTDTGKHIDSMFSDFSGVDLVRPGLGDKMFDRDYGMPLTTNSGSPAEIDYSERYRSVDYGSKRRRRGTRSGRLQRCPLSICECGTLRSVLVPLILTTGYQ